MTDVGIAMDCEPIFVLRLDESREIFIEKLKSCLEASKNNISRPPREELLILQRKNLELMGVKSYSQLYKRSECVRVEELSKGFAIIPYTYFDTSKPSKGLKQVPASKVFVQTEDELHSSIDRVIENL